MSNKRQDIIDALEARVKTIPSIKSVEVWRQDDWQPSDLPGCVIRDPEDRMPADGIGPGRRDHDLTVELVLTYSGNTSDKGVREGVNLLMQALGVDPTLGDLAFDIIPGTAAIEMAPAAMLYSAAQLDITVRYRSGLWSL
jgi:hypothetical protein